MKHLNFVVSPVLHIVFGITLLMYNILLTFCQQFDQEEGDNLTGREQRKSQMQEWQESSISLSEKQHELEQYLLLQMLRLSVIYAAWRKCYICSTICYICCTFCYICCTIGYIRCTFCYICCTRSATFAARKPKMRLLEEPTYTLLFFIKHLL